MLFTKDVMVDLSWCSSYPYQQIQCAEHIVNTKSNYRIILFFLEKKLKWKRIPKTVRKKRYWYTSPGYSKTKIIFGKRATHKIDTSSRPRKTMTWDRGQMSQPASSRLVSSNPWNHMASRTIPTRIPREKKNDFNSMRSPTSSNRK